MCYFSILKAQTPGWNPLPNFIGTPRGSASMFIIDNFIDKIKFFAPIEHKQIDFDIKNFNIFNSPSWWFETGTGDIILFPSDLTHTVDPTVGDETRISLAFNTFAKGAFGSEQTLRALYL